VEAGRGLGLGLFLTDAMMEAQGGSVQLEQRQPAAVFALRWLLAPAERPRNATSSSDADDADGAGQPRSAVVEEDPGGVEVAKRP
jgi:hypothetical protein